MKPTSESSIKILSKKTTHKGFFCVQSYTLQHRLYEGGWSKPLVREVFERPPAVGALPFDPRTEEIILIEQFRAGTLAAESAWLLELVAGMIEEGETIEAVVARELKEESGLTMQSILPIYEYWVSPGATNEYMSLFCVKVDAQEAGGFHGKKEEGEDIKVIRMRVHDAWEALYKGQLNNAATIIALQWLELNYSKILKQWR